jgi:hypothetical protein
VVSCADGVRWSVACDTSQWGLSGRKKSKTREHATGSEHSITNILHPSVSSSSHATITVYIDPSPHQILRVRGGERAERLVSPQEIPLQLPVGGEDFASPREG